jgi:hypothetical protein
MPAKKKTVKARKPKAKAPVAPCPFDPERERAVDCPHEKKCPWHVKEDGKKCFCAVGESPELQMRKMIASRLPKD